MRNRKGEYQSNIIPTEVWVFFYIALIDSEDLLVINFSSIDFKGTVNLFE